MIFIKKNIVYILLFGATLSSFTQDLSEETNSELTEDEIKIGVKTGYSLGSLTAGTDNIYTENYESVSDVDFGLTFEFKLTQLISMQTEINYTRRGGKRSGLQPANVSELSEQLNMFFPFIGLPPITNENPLYATFESESDLQYLEFPALVKFGWGDDFRFSAAIGPYVGILLKANQLTSGNSQFYLDSEGTTPVFVPGPSGQPYITLPSQSLDAETNIKDNIRVVNFGGILALGMSKKLDESSNIFIDARASYGFNAIQINDQYGESNIGGIIFSFGYAYKL
ncbi:MAG: hypothetical protein ACI8RP_000671 [Urechidicola sp.]|jgi:hypothetical protein